MPKSVPEARHPSTLIGYRSLRSATKCEQNHPQTEDAISPISLGERAPFRIHKPAFCVCFVPPDVRPDLSDGLLRLQV